VSTNSQQMQASGSQQWKWTALGHAAKNRKFYHLAKNC